MTSAPQADRAAVVDANGIVFDGRTAPALVALAHHWRSAR
jgi:hypothetical protein